MRRVEVVYVTHDEAFNTLEFSTGTVREAAAAAARKVETSKAVDRMLSLALTNGSAVSVWADDVREIIVHDVEGEE